MIVDDDAVAHFVSERIGREICAPWTAMGIEKDGKIVAGTIFNNFEEFDVHVTVAGDRGAFTRDYLKAVGRYVFEGLGKLRMTAITEQPEVIQIALRLNAQTEGRLRNHFGPGRDGIVLGILKEDWPFKYD